MIRGSIERKHPFFAAKREEVEEDQRKSNKITNFAIFANKSESGRIDVTQTKNATHFFGIREGHFRHGPHTSDMAPTEKKTITQLGNSKTKTKQTCLLDRRV
jgi:hypothetical protein